MIVMKHLIKTLVRLDHRNKAAPLIGGRKVRFLISVQKNQKARSFNFERKRLELGSKAE